MATGKIVFIVGRTASGKSDVAMQAARQLDGEIICADSQTLRRGLDIGTAKPSAEDQAEIPHHMLDVIEPYERFSVAAFKKQATSAIQSIQGRGKIPIVVGGSGLYIDALFYDYSIDDRAHDNEYEKLSVDELHNLIRQKGYRLPENQQNPRHLVGVLRRRGTVNQDNQPIENAVIVGLERSDEELKQRISERIERMFENGFMDEVRKVVEAYGRPPAKLDAIGYPIALKVLDGEISVDEAKKMFARADWQYARRQKAWFKRNKHIVWFNSLDKAVEHIAQYSK